VYNLLSPYSGIKNVPGILNSNSASNRNEYQKYKNNNVSWEKSEAGA
jgi:hypothetical protein